MVGMLVSGGIAACLIYSSMKWTNTEAEKIQHVFLNIGYRIKDKVPRLIRKDKKETYTDYIYNVPYGLVDDPKLERILEKTLIKPVSVMFRGKLIVRVYNKNLTTHLDYDWQPSKRWTVPIGESLDGMIYHDFDKIPHMTVAGMTRQGKTVFLKLVLTHLILNNKNAEFYCIDLKGGLEFGKYKKLKQIKNVASDPVDAESCLESITNQIKADMQLFKSKGYNDITNTDINSRRFIIVDEAAELTDSKKSQKHLSEIARIGGALGYRLIFATQYPTADTLPRQIKQNADAKISFRLPTEVASRVALDEQGAEQIECIGRAIYRTHDRVEIQVPYVKDKNIMERLGKYDSADSAESEQIRTDTIEIV